MNGKITITIVSFQQALTTFVTKACPSTVSAAGAICGAILKNWKAIELVYFAVSSSFYISSF